MLTGNRQIAIAHQATSADLRYNQIAIAPVAVNITEDDSQPQSPVVTSITRADTNPTTADSV